MAVKVTYFVHGTTLDNLEHKSTGWLPGELSEKGIGQSIVLKEQVNINEFDVVFCSDLKRAIDSAKYTFEGVKEIIQDERLRECNYGDYNGEDSSLANYEEHIDEKFPNGECMLDVEKRIKSFCDFLLENYDGKHIAIVAHKAPQLAFQVLTEGKTWEEAIDQDWRKTKSWQPGWIYNIEK
ncbi:MAG: histidine phosphatase family protein [Bacilli bacterium]|nr:histidine phosphatase family protein [Bacilli bacterium]